MVNPLQHAKSELKSFMANNLSCLQNYVDERLHIFEEELSKMNSLISETQTDLNTTKDYWYRRWENKDTYDQMLKLKSNNETLNKVIAHINI